jgi:hypothetical protein
VPLLVRATDININQFISTYPATTVSFDYKFRISVGFKITTAIGYSRSTSFVIFETVLNMNGRSVFIVRLSWIPNDLSSAWIDLLLHLNMERNDKHVK